MTLYIVFANIFQLTLNIKTKITLLIANLRNAVLKHKR